MLYRFVVLLSFFSSNLWAANIKGIVIDANTSEGLVGANVVIKGTTQGTTTNLDGSFTLKDLKEGTTYILETSYLGYLPQEQTVLITNNSNPITFALKERTKELAEVIVSGRFEKETDESARSYERKAENLLNIVSAKAILISPDVTVANVIQRISGISIERNSNGDGQHAILRGMDKRYNYTLVNGVKIPSPDNKYRYVPLDIFPAELLERLEVTKSLTPVMEGDAIGGAINMVMKNAPDKLYLSGNIGTGFSELFTERPYHAYPTNNINAQSPYEINGNTYNATLSNFPNNRLDIKKGNPPPNLIGGFTIGNRFLKDRLGMLLAASLQNTYRGSNSLFFDTENVDIEKTTTITKLSEREFSEQQKRYGIHLKTDFQLNEKHRFQWYNAYLNLSNTQTRETKTTEFSFGYNPELGNANLAYQTRLRFTKQQIINSTLQGEHKLSEPFKIQWSAVFSKADNDIPDNSTLKLLGVRESYKERITYASNLNRRWEHNTDRDLAFYLNLIYKVNIAATTVELSTGGLYRNKERDNFYNNYAFVPNDPFAEYGKDFKVFTDISWRLQNPRGAVATSLTYTASEDIGAEYLQFKFKKWKTQFTGGVRVEQTNQGYAMRFPIGEDRPTGSQIYTDVLPSLQIKYMPFEKVNIRASYFRSLNRPGFFELVPYRIVNEEYTERGNPDLQRAIADNIDLRYEFFPRPNEQLMIGAFYKYIQNPIEYTLQANVLRGQDILYAPGNFGNAANYGLELDAIKYFSKIGIKANYTFTNSVITTPKTIRIRDANGDLKATQVNQTRPLYGQSRHIGNLTLLFKDTKRGLDAQLAGSYTGKRINTVSQFLDNDLWQEGFVQMDASVEKTFKSKFTIFIKANNLLNTPLSVYIQNTNPKNKGLPFQDNLVDKTLVRKDFYQRSYLFGVRYKL